MALRSYEDIVGPLIIPARGKEYALPVVSLADGLRMRASGNGEEELSLTELTKIILGDVKEQMLADGVPVTIVDRALWAGIADFQGGREAAEEVWENGAPKVVLEELAKALKKVPTTPPAGASTTPRPASGIGTKAPRKPASRSRGTKSSPTGH